MIRILQRIMIGARVVSINRSSVSFRLKRTGSNFKRRSARLNKNLRNLIKKEMSFIPTLAIEWLWG
jgi:hypothetical protein